jgi:hypothetical protein
VVGRLRGDLRQVDAEELAQPLDGDVFAVELVHVEVTQRLLEGGRLQASLVRVVELGAHDVAEGADLRGVGAGTVRVTVRDDHSILEEAQAGVGHAAEGELVLGVEHEVVELRLRADAGAADLVPDLVGLDLKAGAVE